MLFTFPSRYWFAIGRHRYLALDRGRPCFPPDFACPAVLTVRDHPAGRVVAYGTLTPSGRPFQRRSAQHSSLGEAPAGPSIPPVQPLPSSGGSLVRWSGLGSSRFARRYYGNPLCSSGYVRCFSSPGALRASRGVRYDHGRVAPFGDLWITGSQRLPRAFRRVGASFIGLQRLGIHHVPIFGSSPNSTSRAQCASWCAR